MAILAPESLPGRGGIGRAMSYLTERLRSDWPDIELFVFPTRYTDRSVWKHLTVPPALAVFVSYVLFHRIGVVHINIAPRGSTWRKMLYERVARALGARIVLHLHGSAYNEFYEGLGPKRQAAVRAFFRRADAVVVLSPYWARFVTAELGVSQERVTQIANGVPVADDVVALHPANEDKVEPLILFLGQIGERKGVDLLLDAFADLVRRNLGFRAVIAGDGEVDAAVKRAAELGLADRVAFPGWVEGPEVHKLLSQADIFVLPSRAENQPVAILEAMARRLPVVSTLVGAIPEQVIDGETGLLVPAGDATALSAALAKLVECPELRDRLGEAGLSRFRAHFSVAACAERFAALYRRM
ncbi:glycosyltransferase family 4 protein [Terrarubrum flagellatum]|uniref:glycosyltransferase family 4 protein n=1 Tax=Terrirubrum flagellatum TaxID=2895980 RepID=UPI003144EDED